MLKYVSGSTTEEIELSQDKIKAHLKTAGLYSHKWEVDETKLQMGSKVNALKMRAKEYVLKIDFWGNKKERAANAETFHRLIETDVLQKTPGRLHYKNYYIECYILSGSYGKAAGGIQAIQNEVRVYAPYPFWIKEEKKQFFQRTEESKPSGLDFSTDFAFDFTTSKKGFATWTVEHYASNNFEMRVYGPCTNPKVTINGYPYQVFTNLESNEFLILDSKNNTVIKYMANGATSNLYNSRQFSPSAFEKIPSGQLTFNWTGDFGFDITLYLERSEPEW